MSQAELLHAPSIRTLQISTSHYIVYHLLIRAVEMEETARFPASLLAMLYTITCVQSGPAGSWNDLQQHAHLLGLEFDMAGCLPTTGASNLIQDTMKKCLPNAPSHNSNKLSVKEFLLCRLNHKTHSLWLV